MTEAHCQLFPPPPPFLERDSIVFPPGSPQSELLPPSSLLRRKMRSHPTLSSPLLLLSPRREEEPPLNPSGRAPFSQRGDYSFPLPFLFSPLERDKKRVELLFPLSPGQRIEFAVCQRMSVSSLSPFLRRRCDRFVSRDRFSPRLRILPCLAFFSPPFS